MGCYLQDQQTQEVEVGHSLKLLVQVQRQEGEEVVFVGLDCIALKMKRKSSYYQTCGEVVA